MALSKSPQQTKTPRGIAAVGIFLIFATVAATFAGFTLLWPDTALDRLWSLNPRAYSDLAPFGSKVGIPFILLAGSSPLRLLAGVNGEDGAGGWPWASLSSSF